MCKSTVLITAVGSSNAIGAMAALRQSTSDVFIVGTDTHPAHEAAGSAMCDLFVNVPAVFEPEAYLAALSRLVDQHAVALVLPILDEEAELLSTLRHEVFGNSLLAIPPTTIAKLCNDKWKFAQWCEDRGIPTPKTFLPEDTPPRWAHSTQLIAKPRSGCGSRGMLRAETFQEIRAGTPAGYVVQECLAGEESTIDVLRLNGVLIASVQRIRTEVRNGQIHRGRTTKEQDVAELVHRALEAIDYEGIGNVQVMRSSSGLHLIEINCRVASGLPLSTAAGVNIPALALQAAQGKVLAPALNYEVVTMCRYPAAVYYDASGRLLP